ncbi:ATP-dependent dethiobiotin synthetase BioD [Streptomyces fumanus]
MTVVVITGTGTEVGKTVVTAAVAASALAAGRSVAVLKAAQTEVAAGRARGRPAGRAATRARCTGRGPRGDRSSEPDARWSARPSPGSRLALPSDRLAVIRTAGAGAPPRPNWPPSTTWRSAGGAGGRSYGPHGGRHTWPAAAAPARGAVAARGEHLT